MKPSNTSTTESPIKLTGDQAWEAVAERDRAHDGVFVYAVSSTGIYCRPSCPSRRPSRSNVSYFPTNDAAEEAGYRSCKRCHPRSMTGTVAEFCIRKAVAFIEDHSQEAITLARLAKHVGLSPYHLQRTFKELVGVSPREYQKAQQVNALKGRLKQGETVTRAIFEAGFGSVRSGYETTGRSLGMTPGEYRKGAPGMAISYTTADSPFGRILVAATDTGICAVALGDTDRALVEELRSEFSAANLSEGGGGIAKRLKDVLHYISGKHPGRALPLHLLGTAFELRVWKVLREIPRGETRSYKQVAESIGAPKSARAVARACAANKAALVVPCHRVVRSDGGLSGYRWGVSRKRAILNHEIKAAP